MNRDYCEHGLAERRATASVSVSSLLISLSGMAHFRGCPHKGDDPDYSDWAELDVPRAWKRLGNGEHLHATGGARQDRVAPGAKTASITARGERNVTRRPGQRHRDGDKPARSAASRCRPVTGQAAMSEMTASIDSGVLR